jgi:hypothetical protein
MPPLVLQLALTLGSIFRHFVPVGQPRHLAASSVVSILGLYLMLRASLWQTVVVDKRCSVSASPALPRTGGRPSLGGHFNCH